MNVLDGVKVNGVAQTITDKKVDISVPTALSQLSADATHRVVTDSEKTAWGNKYDKPSGGIPKSDLASDVQTSLGKADTAIQSHQDISGKANKSEMAVSTSGDKTTITLKTGTSATVLNAHQDISGKVDKVSGKGLSTNDYTTAEKEKLAGVASNAQVNVLEGVKVNGTAQTITNKTVDISVPTALSQLSADATHRVVTDSEKTAWNGKYTKPSGGIPASDLASGVIPDVSQFIKGLGVKNIVSLTKAEYDALANKDSETIYVVEDSHDYVDIGLRDGNNNKILFATCNIGASSPEEYGDYFAWGETSKRYTSINGSSVVGGSFEWYNCPYHTGDDEIVGWSKYIPTGKESYSETGVADNKLILEASDDVASVLWGGGWRMPDKSDLQYLVGSNVTYTWTNDYNGTGVHGFIITGKGPFSSASLFLPAAGDCTNSELEGAGDYGFYWSRSVNSNYPAFASNLYFEDGDQATDETSRYFGQSVRPVHVGDVVPSYKLYKGSAPINKTYVNNNTLYL